jgi:hypothetical protein
VPGFGLKPRDLRIFRGIGHPESERWGVLLKKPSFGCLRKLASKMHTNIRTDKIHSGTQLVLAVARFCGSVLLGPAPGDRIEEECSLVLIGPETAKDSKAEALLASFSQKRFEGFPGHLSDQDFPSAKGELRGDNDEVVGDVIWGKGPLSIHEFLTDFVAGSRRGRRDRTGDRREVLCCNPPPLRMGW